VSARPTPEEIPLSILAGRECVAVTKRDGGLDTLCDQSAVAERTVEGVACPLCAEHLRMYDADPTCAFLGFGDRVITGAHRLEAGRMRALDALVTDLDNLEADLLTGRA
jgi:hypothetical protein